MRTRRGNAVVWIVLLMVLGAAAALWAFLMAGAAVKVVNRSRHQVSNATLGLRGQGAEQTRTLGDLQPGQQISISLKSRGAYVLTLGFIGQGGARQTWEEEHAAPGLLAIGEDDQVTYRKGRWARAQ